MIVRYIFNQYDDVFYSIRRNKLACQRSITAKHRIVTNTNSKCKNISFINASQAFHEKSNANDCGS
jgi:hypothetical protein